MGKHNGYPPVIDPTKNVLGLVAAETRRHDDLREAETRRVDQLAVLRAFYDNKLAVQERERLNEIRNTDVKAVFTASEKQEAAARLLATALTTSAETLRALVATTALAAAENQARYALGIENRLNTLETSRYETKGKSSGIRDTWGWIFGGVMLVLAIGGFILSHWK